MAWVNPTQPAVGTQAAASWADTVSADLALVASPAYFFGSLLTSTAITGGVLINLTTIVEDSLSGWDATNHRYVFKSAGLYLVNAGLKLNGTATGFGINFLRNGASVVLGPSASSIAFGGATESFVFRFAVNDTLGIAATGSYTSQSDSPAHNNYLSITQMSWV